MKLYYVKIQKEKVLMKYIVIFQINQIIIKVQKYYKKMNY